MADQLACIDDFQAEANKKLSKSVKEYFNSGSYYEQTYRNNCDAFRRYRLRPRYMQNVSSLDIRTTLLGYEVLSPIGVSSMSMCRLAHPDGEVGISKACESIGGCMALSSLATSSMDEIKSTAPNGLQFFQIFILKDRELLISMVRNAENFGFKALVLTIDCVVHGRRHAEMRNKLALPPHLSISNFEKSIKKSKLGWKKFVNDIFDTTQTWDDVAWLKSITSLPIIAKGVLSAVDALDALSAGVDAIWVSNHGGRELDTVPATIDVLPEIVKTVNGRCEVYFDGGVRSGLDVLKALAMGAKAVFVGRPVLWGLACNGTQGAKDVLRMLMDELRVGMALSGCKTINELQKAKNLVVTADSYLPKL